MTTMMKRRDGRVVLIRSGWDSADNNSIKKYYELFCNKFVDALLEECDKNDLDPDFCEFSVNDLDSSIITGDPVMEAKRLVHKTMRRLKLI